MVSDPLGEIDDAGMDDLREVGSIGAAHASSALSSLLGKEIRVEVSECYLLRARDLPSAFEDVHRTVVAVFLETYGMGKGNIMLILHLPIAVELADMMQGREHDGLHALDNVDLDAIREVGNICASSYLSAVAAFIGTTLVPSPPGVAMDMLQAVLEHPAALFEAEAERAVVIRTEFGYDRETRFGSILYMPDRRSQAALMKKLKDEGDIHDGA